MKSVGLEECRIGRVQNWKSVGLEEFRIGRVQDWKSVGLEECNIERVWESVESECVIFGFHQIYNFMNFLVGALGKCFKAFQ